MKRPYRRFFSRFFFLYLCVYVSAASRQSETHWKCPIIGNSHLISVYSINLNTDPHSSSAHFLMLELLFLINFLLKLCINPFKKFQFEFLLTTKYLRRGERKMFEIFGNPAWHFAWEIQYQYLLHIFTVIMHRTISDGVFALFFFCFRFKSILNPNALGWRTTEHYM